MCSTIYSIAFFPTQPFSKMRYVPKLNLRQRIKTDILYPLYEDCRPVGGRPQTHWQCLGTKYNKPKILVSGLLNSAPELRTGALLRYFQSLLCGGYSLVIFFCNCHLLARRYGKDCFYTGAYLEKEGRYPQLEQMYF